jgi:hypothetical protein
LGDETLERVEDVRLGMKASDVDFTRYVIRPSGKALVLVALVRVRGHFSTDIREDAAKDDLSVCLSGLVNLSVDLFSL